MGKLLGIEHIRVAVYARFTETGQAATVVELAQQFGVPEASIRAGLRELAAGRHLVLDDQDRIVMAHPFSAVPLGFSVMGTDTLWWGGCAWDAFALPHLIPEQSPVLVATRCPNCGRALAWNVGTGQAPTGTEVAHFLVPVARMWHDVVHTCAHQRLFCSTGCVDQWLEASGNTRGYVMDLSTLWRLASDWYTGRLERGMIVA